jgi:hypothetical protein
MKESTRDSIKGAGSVIDMMPPPPPKHTFRSGSKPQPSTDQALRGDWEKAGESIRTAIKGSKPNERRQQRR